MPGVLIVEAFGHSYWRNCMQIDPRYANKLVYLMSIDKARFRKPVIPDCELHLEIEAVRSVVGFGNIKERQKLMKTNGRCWVVSNYCG